MFLDHFLLSLRGDSATAPAKSPYRAMDDIAANPVIDDVLPSASPALAALMRRALQEAVTPQSMDAQSTQLFAILQQADATSLAVDLLIRLPALHLWLAKEKLGPYSRAQNLYTGAMTHSWQATTRLHPKGLPIDDRTLAMMLRAIGIVVGQFRGHDNGPYLSQVLQCLSETAAARPQMREPLIAMFNLMLAEPDRDLTRRLRTVRPWLDKSGFTEQDVPALARITREYARRDAIYARVLALAGPDLAPAMEAVFAGLVRYSLTLNVAEKLAGFKALTTLAPAQRGAALQRLLRILADPAALGLQQWGMLEKSGGNYKLEVNYPESLDGMGMILGTLATRTIELADPDADMALLLKLQPRFRELTHKKLLDLVLSVVAAHPQGEARQELAKLLQAKIRPRLIMQYAATIEDRLRDSADRTPHVAGDATAPGKDETLALPDWDLAIFHTANQIRVHFENLFDRRLYDAPHQAFLASGAALKQRLEVAAEAPVPADRTVGAALSAGVAWERRRNELACATAMLALSRRCRAFGPLVNATPEIFRKLAVLAEEIRKKSEPGKTWLERGRHIIAGLPPAQQPALIEAMISAPPPGSGDLFCHEAQLRTLIYLSANLDPAWLAPRLTDYAIKQCYASEAGHGIHAEKLGNACVWVLAGLPGGAGVPFLARISARAKYPKIKAKIDAKLNEAAAAAGLSRAELDEITVPAHDLDADGTRRVGIGSGTAVLRISGKDAEVEWLNETGKTLKSPSQSIREDKAALAAFRAEVKELEADLSLQPQRLQRLYLDARSWTTEEWRSRYAAHPLLGSLTRQLVWWADRAEGSVAGLADGNGLAGIDGKPIALDGALIRLWHPMEDTAEAVEAWRDRLEVLRITQPFAQVWREVYALTDAERATGTYSNRFAGHILRQHQAMALARVNDWRVTHRMRVDAPNNERWHVNLPAHGLVADYWVQGTGGDDPSVSESGAYTYVSTDRLQFHPIAAEAGDSAHGPVRGAAVPLADVPRVVFSEVMRHLDLFTAVASIAADPNWLDRGADAAHPNQWMHDAAAYWTRTNTAELEEAGKRRRAMLQRIVPRLKIAAKLGFEERYLTVQGTRHLYRIHLSSGASFCGERHICIVPSSRGAAEKLWLPFEGDQTLSIILSKAVLLAADNKITDPVILAQL